MSVQLRLQFVLRKLEMSQFGNFEWAMMTIACLITDFVASIKKNI